MLITANAFENLQAEAQMARIDWLRIWENGIINED